MAPKPKLWSYSAGEHGGRVTVFERSPGGAISGRVPLVAGGYKTKSLRHRDRTTAKSWADRKAADIREGLDATAIGTPTVKRIMGLYLVHKTIDKCKSQQVEDRRQITMWTRFLTPGFDLSEFGVGEWDDFRRKRAAGTLNATGRLVADPDERVPVGPRVVQKDLAFLRVVCKWSTGYKQHGRPLLRMDPTSGDGFKYPPNPNPKREMADHDRVDAIRAVYRDVSMQVTRGGKREKRESYLPELFEVAVGTGRRITAVCKLRFEDVDLDRTDRHPHGAIKWPGMTDKRGKEWRCEIDARTREAIRAATLKRGAVGSGWLFPTPADPSRPTRYETASEWLVEAERLAGVEPAGRYAVARIPSAVGHGTQAHARRGRGEGWRLDWDRNAQAVPTGGRRDDAGRRPQPDGDQEKGIKTADRKVYAGRRI